MDCNTQNLSIVSGGINNNKLGEWWIHNLHNQLPIPSAVTKFRILIVKPVTENFEVNKVTIYHKGKDKNIAQKKCTVNH